MIAIAKEQSFPAGTGDSVFFRTYSRQGKESWSACTKRCVDGLVELGKLTREERSLLYTYSQELKSLPSGRWLWVGGTDWIQNPDNFSGAYNCTSTAVRTYEGQSPWAAFGWLLNLGMMGCGTGAVLETEQIETLPTIFNHLNVQVAGNPGEVPPSDRLEDTEVHINRNTAYIIVGDSRQGWVDAYQSILEIASDIKFGREAFVHVYLGNVRPYGELLQGFGGVANPVKLGWMFGAIASITNGAVGRQMNSLECCMVIDVGAETVVAGNLRRCLPENALVHTSKGLVPIRDVQVGDLVQTPIGFRAVVDKFDQGMQNVYEIETNASYPRGTANHKYAVLKTAKGEVTWKTVAELEEGDRLLHNTQVLPGTITHLPPDFTQDRPQQSRTAKTLTIPDLTPEVAWLIGFTHGNGYVATGRNKHKKPIGAVSWASNANADIAPRITAKIDLALQAFGLSATHTRLNNENTMRSHCSSIRLAEYFHRYIKQPKVSLEVPGFILQGTIDVRAAYLAGLADSDGSVKNRPPCLVTTVYQGFARQVASILSSLGIAGRIQICQPKEVNWKAKYNLNVPAFKEQYNKLVALHSVKGELQVGQKLYGFTIPGSIMRSSYTYSEMRAMGFQGSVKVDSNYERYASEGAELDIPVTVKGVGSYDHVQTYDIEVEEAHCFYCDGFLTHNSAGMRQGSWDDDNFTDAKLGLYAQDAEGNWYLPDPRKSVLRIANHTRVYHHKPTLDELKEAVAKQYHSGEGAIMWAGEAIYRANRDLISDRDRVSFLSLYNMERSHAREFLAVAYLRHHGVPCSEEELDHRMERHGLNPCGSIDFAA
jgi:ribonucleotide reductase class II